jgi:hypothetical protein
MKQEKMTKSPTYHAAIEQTELGRPVVAIWSVTKTGKCKCPKGANCSSPGKHPITRNGIKDATTDKEVIKDLWQKHPDANLAIVMGAKSGLVALDIDPRNGGTYSLENLEDEYGPFPETLTAQTGGNGKHVFFRYPKGSEHKFRSNIPGYKGIDICADNKYIIVEPSQHASGKQYVFEIDTEEIAELPAWLLKLITYPDSPTLSKPKEDKKGTSKIIEGERNKVLFSIGIGVKKKGLSDEAINAALQQENKQSCIPPLEKDEVERIAQSISKYKEEDDTANKCLLLEIGKDLFCFHDDYKRAFAIINKKDKRKMLAISGDSFMRWLAGEFYLRTGHPAKKHSLKDAITVYEARALYQGPKKSLHNRFARIGNKFFVDLVNEDWSAIEVTENGWDVLALPPITHLRHTHQLPQTTPERGGKITDILEFINVKHPNDKLLILTWIVCAMIPDIPRPIMIIYGSQGSGKSGACRIIRKLLDPSKVEFLEIPSREVELAQILAHHAVPIFDNQGIIKSRISNLLCKGSTGGGISKRKLYSDDEDIIYSFQRSIVINGINIPSAAPDFLDRSILIELRRIDLKKRKTEHELMQKFEEYRPKLLGAIFDLLSEAMKAYPTIKLSRHPRMADFAVWGSAVAVAMGETADTFLDALEANSKRQLEEVLEDDPVAQAIIKFAEEKGEWKDIASTLLLDLEAQFGDNKPRYNTWPKSPEVLSKRLRKLQTSLSEVGVIVEFSASHRHGRMISISKKKAEN